MDNNQPEMTRHARRQMERAAKEAQYQKNHQKSRTGKTIAILAVLAVAGLGMWALTKKGNEAPQTNPNEVRAEDHVKGPENALVTLIEYSDFQCPACASYFPIIKQLEDAFPKDMRVVYRHFPLTTIHKHAWEAATVAEAAGTQGKFWEMHDMLFGRQGDWSSLSTPSDKFAEYAQELGLNLEKLKDDAGSGAIKNRIKADQALANRLRVQSTPTFYVNGTRLTANPGSFEAFKAIVDSALTIAKAQEPQAPQYHAHADLKVQIFGKPLDLSAAKYQSTKEHPLDKNIHLHDGKGTLLHMHAEDANLSRFFSSIDMHLEKTCLTLDTKAKYCNSGKNNLHLYVNNQEIQDPSLYVPKDLDRILLIYGPETNDQINALVKTVPDEACIYSKKCPERGSPPAEECVGGLGTDCE